MARSLYRLFAQEGRLRCVLLVAVVLVLAVLACNAPPSAPTPTPALPPTPTPEPTDTGWQPVEPGVELRLVRAPTGDGTERLVLVRLVPSRLRFRVLYTPGSGRRVSEWMTALERQAGREPLLVVNGGYFTPEYQAAGLLVSDGEAHGTPYGDFAGMFAVLPGGRVEVRWLGDRPYDPEEMVLEAIQSFPVLVRPGGALGFPPDADDGRPARRTVVAQDREGRILFIVAPRGYFTLSGLARWLVASDLGIDVALNLDGGQSTGLYLSAGEPRIRVDSLVPVPSVIMVERGP